jgi:4-aminobutyrate aminotransferase-like enzyme
MGTYLKSRLSELMDSHPIIGEVRGSGLMIAIDLTKNRKTKECFTRDNIYNFLLDAVSRGMLLTYSDWGLSLFPPFNIDEGIADQIVEIMDKTLRTGAIAELDRKARLLKEFAISKL